MPAVRALLKHILLEAFLSLGYLQGVTTALASENSSDDEPPFFVVDANATGSLTLEELQINVPKHIANDLSDREMYCYLQTIDREIAEAGDPATINPEEMPHWGGEVSQSDWAGLSPYQQRVLLAQAIIGGALVDCLE